MNKKYELNTWYHYDEAAKTRFEKYTYRAEKENSEIGRLVLACKNWDPKTDSFYITMFFDCHYNADGRYSHSGSHPSMDSRLPFQVKIIAFMLLPSESASFDDFMRGVKYHV